VQALDWYHVQEHLATVTAQAATEGWMVKLYAMANGIPYDVSVIIHGGVCKRRSGCSNINVDI